VNAKYLVAGALAIALAGCGSTKNRFDLYTPGNGTAGGASTLGKKVSPELNAYLCEGSAKALEEMHAKDPGFPVEQARREMAAACAKGLRYVPTVTATPVPPSPGCNSGTTVSGRTAPFPPHHADKPARPIPFFAMRTGRLPVDGTPVVGGVQLPRGSRCMGYWATDAVVADPVALARKLAAAFPLTGLWPVLWDAGAGEPDAYAGAVGNPDKAGRVDVRHVLRRLSRTVGELAPGSGGASTGKDDPFGTVDPGRQVMLILAPVNRPADVLSALGGLIATEYLSDAELTAVVRSWEERFGATVTVMGPGSLELAVQAPPRDPAQALQLAQEYNAFQPDNGDSDDLDGHKLAARLPTTTTWEFGWPD
jgi:Domain of unknown function (DUF4253)